MSPRLAPLFGLGIMVAALAADRVPEPPPKGWKLVWSDEFDGKDIDRAKWDFDIGNGFFNYDANQWISGWGNDELQYYTREPDNAFVKDGMLHIRALKESLHGCGYTSARLKTRKRDGSPLFSQKYGRFEFRAKLPTGKGVWPALWMLPQDEKYGGWAASGEIDVMEARGQEPTKVLGTLHFGSRWPANAHVSKEYVLPRRRHHRGLPRLRAGVGAGRDPLVRGRPAVRDPVVLVEQRQDGRRQGAQPGEGGRPQPVAGPVRPAVLPGHERGRRRQVPRQSGQDDRVPGGDGRRLRPGLREGRRLRKAQAPRRGEAAVRQAVIDGWRANKACN